MELQTFAYTIGVLELIVGIPIVFYTKASMKWIDKFMKDDITLRIVGVIFTILSTLVLIEDHTVTAELDGIIRLLAWLLFLKGLMYAWWPQTAIQLKKQWIKNESMLTVGGAAACAIGVLLFYAGSML